MSNTALTQHQKATLQAMGIDLYTSATTPKVLLKPWLSDLFKLLNISEDNCVVEDIEQAKFNEQTNQLHLPSSLNIEDAKLKQQLWTSCKNHILPFENP